MFTERVLFSNLRVLRMLIRTTLAKIHYKIEIFYYNQEKKIINQIKFYRNFKENQYKSQ